MPPAYEVLLLNTAVPQIQAAQSGDTYVVPRDIAFSAALTLSAGTANGVPYLNGSKVLTTGSALTFDGTNVSNTGRYIVNAAGSVAGTTDISLGALSGGAWLNTPSGKPGYLAMAGTAAFYWDATNLISYIGGSEQMRLTSTGLGIGTTSPSENLDVSASINGGGPTINVSNTYYAASSTDEYAEFQAEFYQDDVAARRAAGYMRFGKSGDFSANASASTFLAFATRNAGTLAERLRIDSTGYLRMASGTGGIQFNGDTAAANALDDYEEGTWTITLTPETSGSIPTNTALDAGSYTKVGRVVTVTGCVNLGSPSSPVGTYISLSLPFSVADLSELSGRFGGAVSFNDGGVLTNVPIQAIEGETAFRIVMDASTVASGDQFYFSVSYFTS